MITERPYDQKFFNSMNEHAHSAKEIFNILFHHFQPRNIIDIGCGTGIWLKVARDLGIESITGLDGPWLIEEMLLSDEIELITHDLEITLPTLPTYDLAISLEVAEHLSEKRAKSFIKDLCNLSKVVLFSAAIPNQGGDCHINEQWQSYWFGLFRDNNYLCFDIIRHQVWDDERVKSWYKQNCLLYVNKDFSDHFNKSNQSKYPLDIVHKEVFYLNPDKFKYLQIISVPPRPFNLWQGLTLFFSIVSILLFLIMINSH